MTPTPMPTPPADYPWRPDAGDGTYRNPVVCADYSDPDVVRHGDDFWMTASSFNCTPGLPVLHSPDLVNWTLVNHALPRLPDPRGVFDSVRGGEGVWAPAIRHHAGRFWIFFPMPDEGIYVTTAVDPRGAWSAPWMLLEGKGLIDPCPLWDDDGRAYLVFAYARSRSGIKHRLSVQAMTADATRMIGDAVTVFDQPDKHPTLEGPKFHKRDGLYYISAPAGGVATGWQLVLRSPNVFGPYEDKIVLHQGDTPVNGPHQGALVDTPGGEWWFVHFQDAGVYGRIVHLQPAEWVDGWPLMGVNRDAQGVGVPTLSHRKPALPASPPAEPATGDDFAGDALGLQWQWHANAKDDWFTRTPGRLRLHAVAGPPELGKMPNVLLQKTPARAFIAETEVTLTAGVAVEAGLTVMGLSHAAIVLDGHGTLRLLIDDRPAGVREGKLCTARLRVEMADGGACVFSAAAPGEAFVPIGKPFQAKEGHWIGAKIGVFCRATDAAVPGHADFAHFRFGPPVR